MVGITATAGQFRLATGRPFTVHDLEAMVVDPDPLRLTVFELTDDGAYEQVAEVEGDSAYEAARPYPVRVAPAALLGR